MKKFAILGAAALLASCAGNQPKDQYTLNGTIQGVDGQEIYMIYQLNDTTQVSDTTVVENGKFVFSGKMEEPCLATTIYMGDIRDYQAQKWFRFYLEPTEMTVAIDTAKFNRPVTGGSKPQAEQDELSARLDVIYAEQKPVYEAYRAEEDASKREELQEQLSGFRTRIEQTYKEFALSHPDSYLAPECLQIVMSDMDYRELKAAYDGMSERVKNHSSIAPLVKELAALEKIQPGATAPDFATTDVNGNPIRFSEAVKGKYVLLDFWASWCVPCRRSFPHVKDLYNKYKDKGLVVFCVADNDSSEDEWREAIEKDGVQDFFHVLRGLKLTDAKNHRYDRTNDISDKYAVHVLPTKYLIDKDFKVVGRMNDNELDAKLKEIFGE